MASFTGAGEASFLGGLVAAQNLGAVEQPLAASLHQR
jgi:hypothetical protein